MLINYLRERFPGNFSLTQEKGGMITIRDGNAEKGKGFRISITEEQRHFEGLLEFEDYARNLSEYAKARLSESDSKIAMLLKGHPNTYVNLHRYTVENIFEPQTASDNGWALKIGYKKTDAYPVENFSDMLLSFILFLLPYDVEAEEEGVPHSTLSTVYERSILNRSACIAFHGYHCKACGVRMRDIYGDIARNFIHVHHLNPVAISGRQKTDPVTDMVPLCPNCHGIAHLRNPPLTVEEIINLLKNRNADI